MERYNKELKNYKPSKLKSGFKYIGIPVERAEEIMGGIRIEGEGRDYPKGDIEWINRCKEGLEICSGGVASWASADNEGLFLKKGYAVKAWTIIGIYEGRIVSGDGNYVLEMDNVSGGQFRVDAKNTMGDITIYGKINEDIHEGNVNVNLEDMGLILVTKDLEGPCELLTDYGKDYDWDHVKWGSFIQLREELIKSEKWVKDQIRCKDLPTARKGNSLERLLGNIVDGTMDNRALCAAVTEKESGVTGIITSGIIYEKYRFGRWGGKEETYEVVDIRREGKRTSGVLEFAKGWNGKKIIECKWEEILKINGQINTINNMITEMKRKTIKNGTEGDEKPERVNIACATNELKKGIGDMGETNTEEGNNEERTGKMLMGNVNEKDKGRRSGRINAEELRKECFTATTGGGTNQVNDEVKVVEGIRSNRERPDEADQCTRGRVKTTVFMGTGARKRECMRILKGCNNASELKDKLSTMRIWRVEIAPDRREDRVAGDGYCGYTSMAQIINDHSKRYDLSVTADRLEVGMAIRNVINNSEGRVRQGYERFRGVDLNTKERAEMAYKCLMASSNHFLSYKGLDTNYWMRGLILDGRCEELKFSNWVKSHWDGEYDMLQESKFNRRSDRLTAGEWREILSERMLMCRDKTLLHKKRGP